MSLRRRDGLRTVARTSPGESAASYAAKLVPAVYQIVSGPAPDASVTKIIGAPEKILRDGVLAAFFAFAVYILPS